MTLLILSAAILLNLVGRFLIVRKDPQIGEYWRRAVMFCPGAELYYLLLRWEKARLGCLACALSFGIALLVIGQSYGLVPWAHQGSAATQPAPAQQRPELAKARQFKEQKILKLHRYLADWYGQLKTLEGYLCDEMPAEMKDYQEQAAAYQALLTVMKTEQHELETLNAQR